MKYYLHDTNSFNDEKITLLFIKFGYEGLGLFYTLLEKIAMQEKPIKTEVLKAQLKVGKKLEKCWNFMESIDIICSSNGETFNKQLLNFSEKYKIKKEKNKERIRQWRESQDNEEDVTRYESVSNTPKVKESKVKEINISFDVFWDSYDKKVGLKSKLMKKWDKLTDSEREIAIDYIPKYKLSQPNKQWRKDPEGFIGNKMWNNELVGFDESQKTQIPIQVPTQSQGSPPKYRTVAGTDEIRYRYIGQPYGYYDFVHKDKAEARFANLRAGGREPIIG